MLKQIKFKYYFYIEIKAFYAIMEVLGVLLNTFLAINIKRFITTMIFQVVTLINARSCLVFNFHTINSEIYTKLFYLKRSMHLLLQ